MKALVTGASSGMGRDMAKYLYSLGYELYLVARNKKDLNREFKGYKNIHTYGYNLIIEEECVKLYKELKDEKTKLESQIDTVKYFDVKKSLNMVHENILEFEKKKADETKKLSNLLKELEEKQKEFEEISLASRDDFTIIGKIVGTNEGLVL